MRGVGELASRMFGVPINQPSMSEDQGSATYLDDPRYATAIGLIRYAQILDAELPRKTGFLGSLKNLIMKKKR